MRFLTRPEVAQRFDGKTVAIVGSGPGCVKNPEGLIDSHDIVVRISNYKLLPGTGKRTDCFYSFFGSSIRKTAEELKRDGVMLCMCKLPDAKPIDSEWHRKNNKMIGVDYRPHYRRRKDWWFCDTYIPTVEEFMESFNLLGRHQPTTGLACVHTILGLNPKSVYLTGFDFFSSGMHNVNERWVVKNRDDPIRHMPELERKWIKQNVGKYPLRFDQTLSRLM
jgi:hypothetical protein